ncbi:MAG: SPFH domain-containing protein [Gemmatimonadaceae bacterium]
MSLGDFLRKQFIDVIQWTESGPGVLMERYPMQDMEIQNGAKLTVRESQMALFVNEGKAADAFAPGLYTLTTANLPLLTNLMNWDKAFKSPFKSDVYFFSTRVQTNQRWGTQQPITIRDKEFGAVRLRGFGVYSYRLKNPLAFQLNIAGTQEQYTTEQLEPQLRNTVISAFTTAFANSQVPFLDMAANQAELAKAIAKEVAPAFEAYGLALETFTVENLSLPDELQKRLDEKISMNMIGDMRTYTQFQAAQSIPIAAANSGGAAGLGVGLGAGMGMGAMLTDALRGASGGAAAPNSGGASAAPAPGAAPDGETKFCIHCGKAIPDVAKFCAECGGKQ